MTANVINHGQFGFVSPGPQSRPWADTEHDWLNERQDAGYQDAAFNAERDQKRRKELGGVPYQTGKADTEPLMEGQRFAQKSGLSKSLSTPPRGTRERPGLSFNVTDESAPPQTLGGPAPTSEPVTHVFRGVSEDEYQQSVRQGFIKSDGRGAIDPEWEGTNAGIDYATAHSYRSRSGPGRIMRIDVDPADGWFASHHDDYARTRQPIPMSRVTHVTDTVPEEPSFRDDVVQRQKR